MSSICEKLVHVTGSLGAALGLQFKNVLHIKHIIRLSINRLDNSGDFWCRVPYYNIMNCTKSTTNIDIQICAFIISTRVIL